MVKTQLAGRVSTPAVLAAMFVPCQDRMTIESQGPLGQPVIGQEPDDSGDLDFEINRPDPVLIGLLAIRPELTDFPPAPEIVVGENTFFQMDNFGNVPVQEPKRAANADHMYGQVQSI
jgi:hypothetical protein